MRYAWIILQFIKHPQDMNNIFVGVYYDYIFASELAAQLYFKKHPEDFPENCIPQYKKVAIVDELHVEFGVYTV